ncbi:MAG: tetratricopeptide repeat protein [Pseudomonadota bacterium]
MSLLLDALKKAAEQKAQKSKEASSQTAADETLLESSSDDTFVSGREVDPTSVRHDETEVLPGDDTEAHMPEDLLSEQMQTGEDQTIVFAQDDVADFMGEEQYVNREQDTTHADVTEQQTHVDPAMVSAGEEDQTEASTQAAIDSDDTEFQTQVEASRAIQAADDLTEQDRTISDPTESTRTDDTLSQEDPTTADQTDVDDMSLLLSNVDDTNVTARTSLTDPQTPGDQARVLAADDTNQDLGLVDITRIQAEAPEETQAQGGDATETEAAPTQTSTMGGTQNTYSSDSTTTRADSTSTRTYAPDNYDRTLMRLPSDDASRLFAGMKSDSDVVMTADHAKKVFRSKSTAQRVQHYKFYGGIAIVILLAIGVYGLFEMQEESFNIESSLRPLKRDPLPGIIKPAQDQSTDLFAGSVDAQTLEIVENADNAESVAEVVEPVEEAVVEVEQTVEPVEEVAAAEAQPEDAVVTEVAQVETVKQDTADTTVAVITSTESSPDTAPAASDSDNRSSSLEITTNAKLAEKDKLLSEAYAAYQSGNDAEALAKYNEVLELDPGNRNALLARAAINVQNNNSSAAIEDYQALLLANPQDSLAMTSLITVANYSPEETESQLKLMIRDEPQSPYLNFALANSYGAQGRWQEAQGYYFTALENNPDDPNYAYNLAVSLEHIAKPKVAMSYYQRALDNFGNGLATFNRDVVDQRLEMLEKQ